MFSFRYNTKDYCIQQAKLQGHVMENSRGLFSHIIKPILCTTEHFISDLAEKPHPHQRMLWAHRWSNLGSRKSVSGDFFYRKSTVGTTKAAIEVNNGTYCLRKRIKKFPLVQIHAIRKLGFLKMQMSSTLSPARLSYQFSPNGACDITALIPW